MVFKRILLPINKIDMPVNIIKKTIQLAKQLKIKIKAVYVHNTTFYSGTIPPNQIYSYRYYNTINVQQKKKAYAVLKEIKKMGEKENIDIQTILIEGIPEKEVINEAKKNDLIILNDEGTTTLDRIFSSSFSEKILHNVPSAVLLVK
ncbi:MAG: hypothetical protein BV458_05785 [Thermoplasmata archaeon M9B2D]|nr:MAG: hypothetical protein BV458_05785 [Thermoplasmata archaeon M9B2D]